MRAAALALALAMLAAPAAADDARVLVFGSRASLLHEARGEAFSARALQQLALDAMGLGSSSRRAADGAADALPPLQADVFQQVSGYALVLAEDAAAPALVDAALDQYHGDAAYSKLFPASKRRLTTAATALAAKATKAGSTVRCVGSAARCAGVLGQETTVEAVDVDVLEQQYVENDYLHKGVEAEAAFAEELAEVAQLTDELTLQQALSPDSSMLYVVAFSDPTLLGDNRIKAQEAVTTKVTAFLAALQTAHPLAGALVVPVKPIGGVASTAQQQRQLQDADEDSESDEEEEDEDEDEEEEDELDLEAESSSGSKAKAAANATSPISTQDIAEFQIVLWTSVLLGVMLLLAVVAMGNMDVGRDSLLYAKFTTGAGHRKSD